MDTRKFIVCGATLFGAYVLFRPTMLHWGATREEAEENSPALGLMPGGKCMSAMATTLDAPPSRIWPWLVQMGEQQGGWYSWDILDNFGKPSATRVHREWQGLRVGDVLNALGVPAFRVAALEPERFLALRALFDEGIWAFELTELPGGRTRLVVRTVGAGGSPALKRLADVAFWQPAHWVMQTRQLQNLRRLTAAADL